MAFWGRHGFLLQRVGFSRHSRLLWELGPLSGLRAHPVAGALDRLPRAGPRRFHKLPLTDGGLPWCGGYGFFYILALVVEEFQELEVAMPRLLSAHCTCLNMLSDFDD